MFREQTIKHLYCGRCGREITVKERYILQSELMTLRKEGGMEEIIVHSNFSYPDRGFYLCKRCEKEFALFMKNKYPKDVEEIINKLIDENEALRSGLCDEFGNIIEISRLMSSYSSSVSDRIHNMVLQLPEESVEEARVKLEIFRLKKEHD